MARRCSHWRAPWSVWHDVAAAGRPRRCRRGPGVRVHLLRRERRRSAGRAAPPLPHPRRSARPTGPGPIRTARRSASTSASRTTCARSPARSASSSPRTGRPVSSSSAAPQHPGVRRRPGTAWSSTGSAQRRCRRRLEGAGAADPGGLYVVLLERSWSRGVPRAGAGLHGLPRHRRLRPAGHRHRGVLVGQWCPLLAWEPGVGWARDPFVDVLGGDGRSPVADVTLRVSAPERPTVLTTGDQDRRRNRRAAVARGRRRSRSPATSVWRWASSPPPSGRRRAASG